MKKSINSIVKFLSVIMFIILGGITYCLYAMPSTYNVFDDDDLSFNISSFSVNVEKNNNLFGSTCSDYNKTQNYSAYLNFLNIFPIKTVKVNVIPKRSVIPCGTPFGVKIYTEGVIIIGISDVCTENGLESPAKICGLKKGDIITKVNGAKLKNNKELETIIENSLGNRINISIFRNGKEIITSLKPLKSYDDGKYRAGIWVRDSSAGIGTLTFRDKETNVFGGLGHGICDVDTGDILPLGTGDIVEATIFDIQKGYRGVPGELKGCFTDAEPIGQIIENSDIGLYGVLNKSPEHFESIDIAMKQHVRKGAAKLLTTIQGNTPEYYDINIDSINYNTNHPTKNIKISVTDPRLLEKTGGIVQGMSGSPIIQDNMLVGAVTHVFINHPAKGYAIFAETMLTNSNKVFEFNYKKAS